ncbi:hypothetical protein M0R45_008481 [Rubus argutus]|uniref:Uncharacterized protein n=1 Tax=Rubus argutus TaxID=59490 RepID=A0AAW1Y1C0_RUBAR
MKVASAGRDGFAGLKRKRRRLGWARTDLRSSTGAESTVRRQGITVEMIKSPAWLGTQEGDGDDVVALKNTWRN